MPYKVFVAGEEALASDINSYLMSQTVSRFTNASQRTTLITSPVLGQVTVLDSAPGVIEYWNGASWVTIPGGAWNAYTPSLSGDTGLWPSIGNGSLTGRYKLLGEKTLALSILLQMGSTTSANAGTIRFGIPAGMAWKSTLYPTGNAYVAAAGGIYNALVNPNGTTQVSLRIPASNTAANFTDLLASALSATSVVIISILGELA